MEGGWNKKRGGDCGDLGLRREEKRGEEDVGVSKRGEDRG